jgi:hypothetical protein
MRDQGRKSGDIKNVTQELLCRSTAITKFMYDDFFHDVSMPIASHWGSNFPLRSQKQRNAFLGSLVRISGYHVRRHANVPIDRPLIPTPKQNAHSHYDG